jgi:hypothetical protein
MKFYYSVKSSFDCFSKVSLSQTYSSSRVMHLSTCYDFKNYIVEEIYLLFCNNSLITISPYSLLCKRWSQIANTLLSLINSSVRAACNTVSDVLSRPMHSSSWMSGWRFLNCLCQSLTCGNLSMHSTYTCVTWLWSQWSYFLHKSGSHYEFLSEHVFKRSCHFNSIYSLNGTEIPVAPSASPHPPKLKNTFSRKLKGLINTTLTNYIKILSTNTF